ISFDPSRREDSEREDPVRVSLVKIPYFIVVSPDEVHIYPRKSEYYGLIDTGLVHVLDYLFSRGQLGYLRRIERCERKIPVDELRPILSNVMRQQVNVTIDDHTQALPVRRRDSSQIVQSSLRKPVKIARNRLLNPVRFASWHPAAVPMSPHISAVPHLVPRRRGIARWTRVNSALGKK